MEIIFPKKTESVETVQKDFGNFRTKNTPTDGKCMFGAVFIALGRETDIKSVNDLRNFVGEKAEAIGADPFFVELLKTPNQWTGQNYAGIGLEALWYVAQTIEKPIVLIIEEEKEGKNIYRFWDSTQEQHLALEFFYEEVGKFLQQRQEQNPAAIFIYHNGIHFQALVPQDTPQGTPSN